MSTAKQIAYRRACPEKKKNGLIQSGDGLVKPLSDRELLEQRNLAQASNEELVWSISHMEDSEFTDALDCLNTILGNVSAMSEKIQKRLSAALPVLLLSLCLCASVVHSSAAQIELQRPVNGIATVIVRQLQFYPYYTHFASLQTSTNLIVWSAPHPTWRDGDTLYYTFTNRPAVYCRLQVSQVNYNWSR